ncbi:GTP cyclohydrolase FolE2 [Alkalihalobacillus trypoxylicola]|uniref:GTP cyclohydrolase FolE2 n=1 Tax=Alkalihalobacillus trypoxylicola TaxID=519424 RepID=UPI001F2ABA44|nr:GTP cyclohydrolase FolE2 [Alkalihalobacillus trypoxylicola]
MKKSEMTDLQSMEKDYFFHINQVGVEKLHYPMLIHSSIEPKVQQTFGNFKISTSLPSHQKGINMSRIPETLHQYYSEGAILNQKLLRRFSKQLAQKMEQSEVYMKVSYPWFFTRSSPVSNFEGLVEAKIWLETKFAQDTWHEKVGLQAMITTLCPCSKEISEYSAHNQRGIVNVEVESAEGELCSEHFKEELLEVIESNASARIHSILKRPDEKKVTETAFENPRFVEDLIRLIAASLVELEWVSKFTITCNNEESIHQHDAYASLTYKKDHFN